MVEIKPSPACMSDSPSGAEEVVAAQWWQGV